jgi:predicted membrane protein
MHKGSGIILGVGAVVIIVMVVLFFCGLVSFWTMFWTIIVVIIVVIIAILIIEWVDKEKMKKHPVEFNNKPTPLQGGCNMPYMGGFN